MKHLKRDAFFINNLHGNACLEQQSSSQEKPTLVSAWTQLLELPHIESRRTRSQGQNSPLSRPPRGTTTRLRHLLPPRHPAPYHHPLSALPGTRHGILNVSVQEAGRSLQLGHPLTPSNRQSCRLNPDLLSALLNNNRPRARNTQPSRHSAGSGGPGRLHRTCLPQRRLHTLHSSKKGISP